MPDKFIYPLMRITLSRPFTMIIPLTYESWPVDGLKKDRYMLP